MNNRELVTAVLNRSRAAFASNAPEMFRSMTIKADETVVNDILQDMDDEMALGIINDMGMIIRRQINSAIVSILQKKEEENE